MALINTDEVQLKPGSDAKNAAWFSVSLNTRNESNLFNLELSKGEVQLSALISKPLDGNELEIVENNGLAFDHAKIIACAILKLREKAGHSDSLLNLVADKFASTKIKDIYEAILVSV